MFSIKPRAATLSCLRRYSTTPEQVKPPLKLVAELRKLTEVSISKAREALVASNNDVQAALKWLQEDLAVSGAKKAAKLESRTANEGLIGVSILSQGAGSGSGGVRGAMVELNCETDFVARNNLFGKLLADISHTAAFITDKASPTAKQQFTPVSLELLQDAPLLSQSGSTSPESTVATAIRDLMTKVGEKISLRRAIAVVRDPLNPALNLDVRLASYSHGSVHMPSQGRIGALVSIALNSGNTKLTDLLASETFRDDLAKLERSIARQIVGFPQDSTEEGNLYNQPFMMYPGSNGETVRAVLKQWAAERSMVGEGAVGGVAVLDFAKWTVGEPIEA